VLGLRFVASGAAAGPDAFRVPVEVEYPVFGVAYRVDDADYPCRA
jgi:hypothetical protein